MTIREISKRARMSFRDIGAVLKKSSGEIEEKQEKEKSSLSPSSKAYQLFLEGKTLLEVAISLNLDESEASKYYEEYLNLKQMDDLQMIYDEIGVDIIHFLKLYKLSKDAHMGPEHVVNLLQISNDYLPLIELKRKKLTKEIALLKAEKQKSRDLGNQVGVLTKVLEKYKEEIKNLQKEKKRLEILNSGRYEKVKQIVEKEVSDSLPKERDILKVAVGSLLESISQDPAKFNFLVNSSQYGKYGVSHPYIDAYRNLILDEAQKLFELMARNLTSRIINETAFTIRPPQAT
jgi:hypothetical protein